MAEADSRIPASRSISAPTASRVQSAKGSFSWSGHRSAIKRLIFRLQPGRKGLLLARPAATPPTGQGDLAGPPRRI